MSVDLSTAEPGSFWETFCGECVMYVARDDDPTWPHEMQFMRDCSYDTFRDNGIIGRTEGSSYSIKCPWPADRPLPDYVPEAYRRLMTMVRAEDVLPEIEASLQYLGKLADVLGNGGAFGFVRDRLRNVVEKLKGGAK